MAARTGMASLITRLRAMTNAGTADFTIGGTAHWSDEHLQAELDSCRIEIRRELLRIEKDIEGGTVTYRDYFSSYKDFEEATGGSAVWRVESSNGTDFGTANYTANYESGHIRMAADTGGTIYYLTARSYPMNKVAVNVWRRKAASGASQYDFSADGQSLKRSQYFKHCMEMADSYDRKGGGLTVSLVRTDVN